MRLLIVEDQAEVRAGLIEVLQDIYVVSAVETGREAFEAAHLDAFDVILLDLSLPDMSGLDVCRYLRADGSRIPIIILTARTEQHDKITLLDAGADDYITKPFALPELLARLRVATRRGVGGRPARLVAGSLVLDTAERTVMRDGQDIFLRRKEFDLLEYLMINVGHALTRSMIADRLWQADEGISTNSIDVHIKYLRDKIDRPFSVPLIKTVHGIGYKLDSPNLPRGKGRGGSVERSAERKSR